MSSSSAAAPVELPDPAARDWTFPRAAAGIDILVEFGRRQGLAPRSLLAGTGLPADGLDPRAEITAAQELRVVRNLVRRLGADIGPAVGRCYQPESFGVFGFALLSSRTLLDAMQVALRFIDLSHTFALPSAEVVGEEVVVRIDGTALPPDVRRVLVARDATAVHQVLDALLPGGVGGRLGLGPERAELRFGVGELDRPLAGRDERSLALARRLCREVVEPRRRRTGLAQDVRVLVAQRLASGAPMGEVAADLGLSERSLRRRLAAEGVGYRELLDEVRDSLARELLGGRATMPVGDLAVRLGYAEATSFIAAFRRWTGTTPTAYSTAVRVPSTEGSAWSDRVGLPS